jgi:hypothetical protein
MALTAMIDLTGVVDRADHHANSVDQVALTIAGAVAWRTESDLVVRTYQGRMANVMRVRIAGPAAKARAVLSGCAHTGHALLLPY